MNIFSFIKDKLSILEIISQYTTLKRAGGYWKGTCPFHNEKTGSFTVSPDKEMFYCFGCHEGGDVITFISKIENSTPLEAVKILADRYAIELPESIKHEVKHSTSQKERFHSVGKAISLWCNKQLSLYEKPRNYVAARSINQTMVSTFTLGYMPQGLKIIKQFIDEMAVQMILLQDLIDFGFLAQGKNILYSPYEDRIIFPIKDYVGQFCGFGGRVYLPEDGRPKYYNSKEHDYFVKSSIVFGLHEAKKEIQKQKHVFLVEGYMDCISMVQHGYPHTVATLGTACTLAHLKLLSRYAHELYVLYDADKAGHNAILRLVEMCWQVELSLKIVQLPLGQDPDSFLRAGNDLSPFIAQAQDIFFFFIESVGQGFAQKTVHEKVALSKHFLTIIKTVEDPFTKDLLLQQAAKTFDIPFDSLRHELNRTQPPVSHEKFEKEKKQIKEEIIEVSLALGSLEKKIFCAILHNVKLVQDTHHKMLIYHIPEPYKALLKCRINLYKEAGIENFTDFFAKIERQEQYLVSKTMIDEAAVDDTTFDQIVIYLHKKRWKMMVKEIMQQLNQAKSMGDEARTQEILQDFLALKEKIIPTVT